MPGKKPLSLELYKVIAETRGYVTQKPARCRVAANWLDLAYSFDAIAERDFADDARIYGQLPTRPHRVATKARLHDPRHETFARLTRFCRDAVEWDLSQFTDQGLDLHAHAILYVNWLITDPEAPRRGLRLTTMENASFEAHSSDAAKAVATEAQEPNRNWYMDRQWVRLVVFEKDFNIQDSWFDLVRIALYEVSLPRPKTRGISTAEMCAAQSYLWVIQQQPDLRSEGNKRFTAEQHKYVRLNDCPAYREKKCPAKFRTWMAQASRGMNAMGRVGGIDLDSAALAGRDQAEVEPELGDNEREPEGTGKDETADDT
jgi:hypothetical protein